MTDETTPSQSQPLSEDEATALVEAAVAQVGGTRMVYRMPRQAFSFSSRRTIEVEGRAVEIIYGEIASPAIATVAGWTFQINDDDIELLMRPPKPRAERRGSRAEDDLPRHESVDHQDPTHAGLMDDEDVPGTGIMGDETVVLPAPGVDKPGIAPETERKPDAPPDSESPSAPADQISRRQP